MSNFRKTLQTQYPELTGLEPIKKARYGLHFHTSENKNTAFISGMPVCYERDGELHEIDTAWQPSTGAWQYEMTSADYQAYARNQLNAGDAIRYEHPQTGNWVMFQPLALNWVNQYRSREQIAQPQSVMATVLDDKLRWNNGYGTGRHFEWQALEVRLEKNLIIDAPEYLPTPASWLGTGELWLELEFIIKNSEGVELWLDGVQWTRREDPIQTTNRIEFRSLATGEVLWLLDYPYATDAAGDRVIGQFELRAQSGNYYITVRIPQAWITTAQFPIRIDPTLTLNDPSDHYTISGSSWNTWEEARSTSYDSNPGYDLDARTVGILWQYESPRRVFRYFARFDTSSIGSGKIIDKANLCLDLYYIGVYNPGYSHFDIQVVKQDWSEQFPISNLDVTNREAAYDNCLTAPADNSTLGNTASLSTTETNISGDLDPSWINPSGYTYYSFRSSRDKNFTLPGPTGIGQEYVHFERLVLVVDYSLKEVHALTANGITAGTPTLGSPTLGQVHALTGTAITATAPVLGQPVIGQVHVLTGAGIVAGAPVLGAPAIGQLHALAAAAITAGSPALGSPIIAQIHALTAVTIEAQAPALGAPAIGQVHALTATAIVTGQPVLDAPAIGQVHALTASGIVTGTPEAGQPVIGSVHVLVAALLLAGAPVLGAPYLFLGQVVTPTERIYTIHAENRTYTVAAENRTYTIRR